MQCPVLFNDVKLLLPHLNVNNLGCPITRHHYENNDDKGVIDGNDSDDINNNDSNDDGDNYNNVTVD